LGEAGKSSVRIVLASRAVARKSEPEVLAASFGLTRNLWKNKGKAAQTAGGGILDFFGENIAA
jgi:hypothetical protein